MKGGRNTYHTITEYKVSYRPVDNESVISGADYCCYMLRLKSSYNCHRRPAAGTPPISVRQVRRTLFSCWLYSIAYFLLTLTVVILLVIVVARYVRVFHRRVKIIYIS